MKMQKQIKDVTQFTLILMNSLGHSGTEIGTMECFLSFQGYVATFPSDHLTYYIEQKIIFSI